MKNQLLFTSQTEDSRGWIEISQAPNNWKVPCLKVETFNLYSDSAEYVYIIEETKDFNSNTDWEDDWNDCTEVWQALEDQLDHLTIKQKRQK